MKLLQSMISAACLAFLACILAMMAIAANAHQLEHRPEHGWLGGLYLVSGAIAALVMLGRAWQALARCPR